MAQVASKGLTRAQEIYQERDRRVRELKAEGKKIMGYLCIYPPLEVMTGLDFIPYRLFGNMEETVTEGDKFLPVNCCSFLRSTLDLGLKGKYDFLDGQVFAHICEVGRTTAQIWRVTVDSPYTHIIDTPHTTRPEQFEHYKVLIKGFQESLEALTGQKLTPEKLKEAIKTHNQQRALVRELYDLRKPDPPLISGVETLQVIKAVMSLPIDEGNALLREVMSEVKERTDGRPEKKPARLLIWGPVIDYIGLPEMIESLNANIVMDCTCVGSRAFFPDVAITDDPLDGLSYHYLADLKCARTQRFAVYGATVKDNQTYLEDRFGYLKAYIKDWNVNGVVLETMRYCDAHGYEVPLFGDYLDSLGVPHIAIEQDYSAAALAPLRTRIQGFLEVISG